MPNSSITFDKSGGMSFSGPDAVEYYRVHQIKSGLVLYQRTRMLLTRGLGITKLLSLASQVTGKRYKRTQISNAIDDLQIWLATAASSLPINRTDI